jgi:hypothetical protein
MGIAVPPADGRYVELIGSSPLCIKRNWWLELFMARKLSQRVNDFHRLPGAYHA